MAVDPWGSFNQSMAGLNDTFRDIRATDRQAKLDDLTAQTARQRLAMGNMEVADAERKSAAQGKSRDAFANAPDTVTVQPIAGSDMGPGVPVSQPNPARAALAANIATAKANAAQSPWMAQQGGLNDRIAAMQAELDATPEETTTEGPRPQPVMEAVSTPATTEQRTAAAAQAMSAEGFHKESLEMLNAGMSVNDVLLKQQAKAKEYGSPELAAAFEAKIAHLERTEDLMAKLRKADPSGNMLKQFVSAHPEEFSGIDPKTLTIGANGIPMWNVNQNGVEGVAYQDTDGKIKFQASNEHRNQTWGEPYAGTVGGKKVMLQKSSTGEVRAVAQDASTTTHVTVNASGKNEVDADAQAILAGTLAPAALGKRNGHDAKVRAAVLAVNPNFNFTEADANAKYKQNVQTNRQYVNLEAVKEPIKELAALGKDLDGSQVKFYNNWKNVINSNTGDTKIIAYRSMRNSVIQELANAMRGAGISEGSINLELANFNDAYSPQQIQAATDNTLKVIEAKQKAIRSEPFAAKSGTVTKGGFKVTVVP